MLKNMRHRLGPVVCLALMLASASGWAASAATAQLEEQARYWEQKGRYDLARQTWLKLQRIEPDSATALAGLATAEVRSGRPDAARQYLEGLRALQPNHPELRRVEAMLAAGPQAFEPGGEVSRARELAQQGKYDSSVAEYRKVFGGAAPDERYALEYWQTLAGAEGGWSEARTGLEGLVKKRPANADYKLALAQHLTYRESTRRQGLEMLQRLAVDGGASQPVQPSWRQALMWMGGDRSDEKYFEAYLNRYGDDTQVSNRLAQAREGRVRAAQGAAPSRPRIDVRGRELKRAWALYNNNQTEEAEQAFKGLLARNRNDAEAMSGIGIIRLRQERYADARQILERASRISPRRAHKWRTAESTARFWEGVREAEALRANGDIYSAEQRLRRAIKASPQVAGGEPTILVTLADLRMEQGYASEAEKIYRKVLDVQPNNADAARGLMGAMAKNGRTSEALAYYRQLPEGVREAIGPVSSYEALALRQQAAEARAIGDDSGAEQLLKQALSIDPQGTWPRLDLAVMYLQQNRRSEARSLVDGLPVSGPLKGEGAYIRALIAGEDQSWFDALMWLEQVPEAERNAEMAATQRNMWVRYQTERAAVFARQGYEAKAIELLAQVEPYATSPGLVGSAAFAYVEANQQGRGLYLLRQAIAQSKPAHPDLLNSYAGLLLKLGQYTEFDMVLDQLAGRQDLDIDQRGALIEMRVAQRLRQADAVREDGNIARAYDLLEPALRANPRDPRLVMALARLYDEAGEHDRSVSLYRYALELDPQNLDAYQGAIQANLAVGNEALADDMLSDALQIAPNSSRLHVLAGRIAKARGQDGRALRLFKEALALGPGSDGAPGTGALRLQYLDSHLMPVHSFRADLDSLKAGVARARYASTANGVGAAGRLIKVAGMDTRMATNPTASPRLPTLYPPGYKPPVSADAAPIHGPALKMDAPSSFNPPEGNRPLMLRQDPVLRSRDYAYDRPAVPTTPVDELLREIAELSDKRQPWAGVGFGLRSRDGRSGLDRLDDVEMPIEISLPGGDSGRMNFRLVPVYLDAGAISGPQAPLFGTLALSDTTGLNIAQDDSGFAIGASYEVGDLHVDVGTSPLGFQLPVFVGGLRWSPQIGNWAFGAEISRRSVTDSLLSYAGSQDPLSGAEFGGVTATGGRVDLAYDYGKAGLYGTGGFHVYKGENVSDNHRSNIGGGAFFHVLQTTNSRVTAGVDLTAFFFDENLRHFTLGHGGYFSPQHYVSLSVPVSWTGGHKRFSWKAYGSIGLQTFREDGASLFPGNAGLQADVEQFAIDNPDPVIATGYAGQSSTGTGMTFGGRMEYLVAPNLVLGGSASFDNASDYDETRALVFLRWTYEGRNAVRVPPEPVLPYADYGRNLP